MGRWCVRRRARGKEKGAWIDGSLVCKEKSD
jgi:hypothetical protein